ncbi:aflatoxin biosynthesis ketoreductase-like protein nor-1 [Amylocarpus encephaloides]|uniref:Aflatoxin biosynthesis ketoreductase-like protein nor-1 n=1 Tax=Amylocarpus encephaloides TaxID=45428 RepID=A0A9P7Y9B3_9HELO|nr:aflatoxin biosynthesis ketoreductase-like protein nor-1 [Amylocarpus encephaloides]
MSSKVYLVTGANRGLGRGFIVEFAKRTNTTIIAGVRDLESPSSKSLATLPVAAGTKIIAVQIEVASQSSIKAAIKTLQEVHNITTIDVVISNAGISAYYGSAATTPLEQVREHFEVNAIGTLSLFQETWPLLQKSKQPTFMAISTGISSLGAIDAYPMQATAYGMSKVAVNYAMRKMHFENEGLVTFVICPGWVDTDMGSFGAKTVGMEKAPVTVEQSIGGIVKKLDAATRETVGGTFLSFDDAKYPW